MAKLVSSAVVTALIVGLVVAAPARAASGSREQTQVHCGQVITTSVKLANDLVDCATDGLVIGAPGITVDLNGHRIDGTSGDGAADIDTWCYCAVANYFDGYPGLTVKNGRVSDFYDGVASKSDRFTVQGIKVTHSNHNGIAAYGGAHIRVADSESDHAYRGVYLYGVTDGSVTRTSTSQTNHIGISFWVSDHVSATENVTDGRISPGVSSDYGLEDVSNTNLVFADNVVKNFYYTVGIGIVTKTGVATRHVLVKGNKVTRSGIGIGVSTLVPEQDAPSEIDDVTITDNEVTDNPEQGIWITGPPDSPTAPTNVRVINNVVLRNGLDGIWAEAPDTSVGSNIANGNGGLGIFADPGVHDLGHNVATKNKDPRQCVGVVCTKR
jgi:hypothetical protein